MSVTNFRRASFKKGLPKTSKFADIPAPIPAPTFITTGLFRWYDANNPASYPGTGTTWTDLQGSGYNMILTNGPTFTAGTPDYFTFDGSNDYARADDNDFPTGTNRTFSMGFWVYNLTTNDGGISRVGNRTFNQQIGYFIQGAGGTYAPSWFADIYGAALSGPGNNPFTQNVWTNLYFTMNATGNYVFYTNGVQYATGTNDNLSFGVPSAEGYRIGFSDTYGNFRCAEATAYNITLTPAQVLQNFNAQKTTYGY